MRNRTSLLMWVVLLTSVPALGEYIRDVTILPDWMPSSSDTVSIVVSGQKGATNHFVDYTDFSIEGDNLVFDVYWDSEGLGATVMTDYTYVEEIGTIPAGDYSLEVFSYLHDLPFDYYPTYVHVTPEPGTIMLVGFGGLMLRRRKGVFSRKM